MKIMKFWFLSLLAVTLLSGCEQRVPCLFEEGSMVRSVVTGAKGQIVRRWSHYSENCTYKVRFPSNQFFTDSRILSDDGPITAAPLTTIWMKEFEIKETL